MHLKKVFEVSSCKLLHGQSITAKSSDGILPKRWDLMITMMILSQVRCHISHRLPFIQSLDGIATGSIQNPHQMGEYSLSNTQLKFMQEIWNEHCIVVKAIWSKFC